MAHFIRGKQAGIQSDFSANIGSDLFVLDDLLRVGVSSQISQVAYDPVQSILAVGTNSTKFGPGQVYVFGQKRINITFQLARQGASVKVLQFCSDRIVVLDSKNDVTVFSLPDKKCICSYSPPATATTIATDPTLDYVMIGLQTGDIVAYDMDRASLTSFRVANLWREHDPRARNAPILSMQFHPRDIGKLLIGYTEGAVIYSFKKDEPRKFFQYTVPRGAPGGDSDPSAINRDRNPRLVQALWHPTGTFVLTAHEDSSLVVWDSKDARVIMARTLTDTYVNQVGANATYSDKGPFVPKAPPLKVAWCAKQDPDDTGILMAGGASTSAQAKGLTFLELGRTPNYSTSSWQMLSDHFDAPKRHHILPTPPNVDVVSFCLIPRKSPWFSGAQDPIAVIAVLSSGEITTLSFPSGYPISPTNQLHPSLTFVHPFAGLLGQTNMDRGKWLGMTETRSSGPPILKGGVEAPRPLKRFESRTIVQTAHADGTIRIWDIGHADEIENESLCQADIARAIGRAENVFITQMSLAGASGELAAGLRSGEIVVFRWSRNNQAGRDPPPPGPNNPGTLTNVTERKDPSLTEGFHPATLLDQQNGACTALKVSDVGFIAAGYEQGSIVVIDMRGPAIIFNKSVLEFAHKDKSSVFRKKSISASSEWPTALEFSVMTLEDENYSSILLHVGTNRGNLITLKILPEASGRYNATFSGATALEGQVVLIHPLNNATGQSAFASQNAVGRLRGGLKVEGSLLVVTKSEVRLFKPPIAKGASRDWGSVFCDCAMVTTCQDLGSALTCLLGDGTARCYSLPGLREIGNMKIDHIFDVRRFSEAVITPSGQIIGWTGPSEVAMVQVWGTGQSLPVNEDKIFNPQLLIPPRPTISNFQWVSGTQYITPSDMDILISGPDRPPSKRMIAQARADDAAKRSQARSNAGTSQEGWGEYMQRQINERTERLGIAGDRMDSLESNSAGWADDVNDFVSRQKKNLIMGAVKGKFGF